MAGNRLLREQQQQNFGKEVKTFRENKAAFGSSLLTCTQDFFLTLNVFASISERILQKIFSFLFHPTMPNNNFEMIVQKLVVAWMVFRCIFSSALTFYIYLL